jgi:hypothetical protein
MLGTQPCTAGLARAGGRAEARVKRANGVFQRDQFKATNQLRENYEFVRSERKSRRHLLPSSEPPLSRICEKCAQSMMVETSPPAAGFDRGIFQRFEEPHFNAILGIGRKRLGKPGRLLFGGVEGGLGHPQRRKDTLLRRTRRASCR